MIFNSNKYEIETQVFRRLTYVFVINSGPVLTKVRWPNRNVYYRMQFFE